MAIRIIKHGNKRVTECKNCGCKFEYEKEDVRYVRTSYNDYDYYIDCPDCMEQITVSPFK